MLNLGTVRPGSTIRIPFTSFDKDDGSAITMTNYAAADILVYKDGNTTERASTAGFTATTDFDGKTGKHLAVIDLADNTTAGFWNAGSEYLVAVDAVTIDTVTTGGWIARFSIGYQGANLDTTIATLSTQTSFTLTVGPAEDDALNGHWAIIHDIASAVQRATVLILDYTGSTKTVTLVAGATFTAAAGDNISIMDVAPLQPTTLGRTLDVSTGGEAGLDWANIGSPTTAQNLSATNIDVDQVVASVSGAVGSVTGAVGSVTGNVGGNVTGSVGTVNALANNSVTAAALAADAGTEIGTAVWATTTRELTALDEDNTTIDIDASVRAAVGLASANLDTQLDALPTAAENSTAVWAAGTRSLTILDEDSTTLDLDATIRSAVGLASANLDTQLAAIDDAVDTEVAAIKAVTDKLNTTLEITSDATYIFTVDALANGPSGSGSSPSAIADEVQTRTIAAVTMVNGLAANTVNASALAADAVAEIQSGLATQTSVDDLPTNAELATALGTADDAVLAAIDALPTATENADALLNRDMSTGADSGSTTVRTPRQAFRILRNKWTIDSDGLQTITKEDDSTPSWTQQLATDASATPVVGTDPAGP